jgi:hypothetical protein
MTTKTKPTNLSIPPVIVETLHDYARQHGLYHPTHKHSPNLSAALTYILTTPDLAVIHSPTTDDPDHLIIPTHNPREAIATLTSALNQLLLHPHITPTQAEEAATLLQLLAPTRS